MQMQPHITQFGRHARLFELIRQRNLAEMAQANMSAETSPGPGDTRRFIAQAERSFRIGAASADTFKFAV